MRFATVFTTVFAIVDEVYDCGRRELPDALREARRELPGALLGRPRASRRGRLGAPSARKKLRKNAWNWIWAVYRPKSRPPGLSTRVPAQKTIAKKLATVPGRDSAVLGG